MTEVVHSNNTNDMIVTAGGNSGYLVDAVLHGGPADLPQEIRAQRVPREEKKLKIAHYGGHEHFERDVAALGEPAEVVFRWTGRTRVAE